MNEATLKDIARLMVVKAYKRGEMIFAEGDAGEAIFILKQGRIKLTKVNPDGKEQILHFVEPGGIFAEVVLFDAGPYPATAEVIEDARVGMLLNSDLEGLVCKSPKIALQMLRLMSRRLRAAQRTIRDLALHDTYSRLAGVLLRYARKDGIRRAEGIELELFLTRQELANFIGTTRETVARILSKFQADGSVKIRKRGQLLIDEEKLRSWV
ncbi:MAG: Crp/Fnr family transcriptional regulator [Dethiobacteria bacterium]